MQEIIALTKSNGDRALANVEKRFGNFVVHKDVLGWPPGLWKVTHEPSSAGMAQCVDQRVANMIASALENLGAKWPSSLLTEENREEAQNAIRQSVPMEFMPWLREIGVYVIREDLDQIPYEANSQ